MNTRSRNLLIVVAVAVVLLFVVAIALGGGDDAGDDVATGTGGGTISQYRAVDLSGQPLPEFVSSDDDPAVGRPAPTIVGHSFDGSPMRVSADDGSPKLLVFLAHWCPHCQAEVPVVRDWIDDGGADGLDVYAISTSATDTRPNWPPSEWLADERWPAPVVADDESSSAGAAFGLSSFPYFVLVDADGNVAARGSGELAPADLDALADLVR